MEINYSHFIEDLTNRTIQNLEKINSIHEESTSLVNSCDKVYEVTQLLNSMLSLLVFPEEIFGIRRIDDLGSEQAKKTQFSTREKNLKKRHEPYQNIIDIIDTLKRNGKLKYKVIDEYVQNYPVCSFINSLRNSICHEGVGFLPIVSEQGGYHHEISEVIFRSVRNDHIVFMTQIDIFTLEVLLREIAKLYSVVERGWSNSKEQEYRTFFEKIATDARSFLPYYTQE